MEFICELRLSTSSRLPLTRELSPKVTEGEKLKKSYCKIHLSLRLLMCKNTHQNPPPSVEGGGFSCVGTQEKTEGEIEM